MRRAYTHMQNTEQIESKRSAMVRLRQLEVLSSLLFILFYERFSVVHMYASVTVSWRRESTTYESVSNCRSQRAAIKVLSLNVGRLRCDSCVLRLHESSSLFEKSPSRFPLISFCFLCQLFNQQII